MAIRNLLGCFCCCRRQTPTEPAEVQITAVTSSNETLQTNQTINKPSCWMRLKRRVLKLFGFERALIRSYGISEDVLEVTGLGNKEILRLLEYQPEEGQAKILPAVRNYCIENSLSHEHLSSVQNVLIAFYGIDQIPEGDSAIPDPGCIFCHSTQQLGNGGLLQPVAETTEGFYLSVPKDLGEGANSVIIDVLVSTQKPHPISGTISSDDRDISCTLRNLLWMGGRVHSNPNQDNAKQGYYPVKVELPQGANLAVYTRLI